MPIAGVPSDRGSNLRAEKMAAAALLTCSLFMLFIAAVHSFPHQDTCVADFDSQTVVDGFPCKNQSTLTADDFSYKVRDEDLVVVPGLKFVFMNVFKNPGLNTQGMSMSYALLDVGGITSPHVHPRSSETFFIVSGCVYVAFVSTPQSFRNNKVYGKVICENEMFVFPQGLVHFQMNVGSKPAFAIGAFNHENPGSQNIPRALFQTQPDVPDYLLNKAFGFSEAEIEKARQYLSSI